MPADPHALGPSIALADTPLSETCEFESLHIERVTGGVAVVAVDSTALGPAVGGLRRRQYPTTNAAVRDALQLARAMTYKAAVASLPFGGGKSVLYEESPSNGDDALVEFGRLVESLSGRYVTAPDVGTSEKDMNVIASATRHVTGRSREHGGRGDPSATTAQGVIFALEAISRGAGMWDGLRDMRVAVSGLGKVGFVLAVELWRRGARLVVADINPNSVDRLRSEVGPNLEVCDADEIHTMAVDVFAPCALGGVLSESTVPELAAPFVLGAANNQLTDDSIADLLDRRGVTYVPDFAVNAGGLIHVVGEYAGFPDDEVEARVAEIGETTSLLLAEASRLGTTPLAAAYLCASERLSNDADRGQGNT